MKRKLGIMFECVPEEVDVTAQMIADAGFSNTFSGSYDMAQVEKIKNACTKNGIELEFLHAPFFNINSMWVGKEESKEIFTALKKSIDCASANGIKSTIVHAVSGWTPPPITDHGSARYDEIVEYAEKKGVIVDIENLRKLGYVSYLMERYENNPWVKFCYDCGHEHCYTEVYPFLKIFGHKMICTHIHDNMGRSKFDRMHNGDIHLLPFDGNIDYQTMIDDMDALGYDGSIMLEVWKHDAYKNMGNEEFISEAYKRGIRLNNLSKT